MQSPWTVFLYMVLMGTSAGFGKATVAALQVEFFGTTYIGTVRSMFASLMVLSSAFGPAAYGIILDIGYDFDIVFIFTLILLLVVILQSFRAISPFALKRFKYKFKQKFAP
jgi:MFS family permease